MVGVKTQGQTALPLDVYRWFLATLSPFPVFQQYTLLFTVANGVIAQQTFEAYAAYVLPQLHNILAHSNPRPFPGHLEGHEDGAYEDMVTGDLLYPNLLSLVPYHQLCPTTLVPYPLTTTAPLASLTLLPNTVTLLTLALTRSPNYPHPLADCCQPAKGPSERYDACDQGGQRLR